MCTLSRDKPHPTNPPAISPLLTLTLLRSQGSAIVDELALQGQCRKNAIVESVCQSLQEGEDEGAIREVFERMVVEQFISPVPVWKRVEASIDARITAAKSGNDKGPPGGEASSASPSRSSAPVRKRRAPQGGSSSSGSAVKRRRDDDIPAEMKFMMMGAGGADEAAADETASASGPEAQGLKEASSSTASASSSAAAPSGRGRARVRGRGRGTTSRSGRGGKAGTGSSDAVVSFAAMSSDMTSASVGPAPPPDEDAMWRLCSAAFHQKFKHDICAKLATDKYQSEAAGTILRTMLRLGSAHETLDAVHRATQPVVVQDLFDALQEDPENTITRDHLINYMKMLQDDTVGIVTKARFPLPVVESTRA